jgi:hypothetical protein
MVEGRGPQPWRSDRYAGAFADLGITPAIVIAVDAVVVPGDGCLGQVIAITIIPPRHLCEGGVRVYLLVVVENLAHHPRVRGEPNRLEVVKGGGAHGMDELVGISIGSS